MCAIAKAAKQSGWTIAHPGAGNTAWMARPGGKRRYHHRSSNSNNDTETSHMLILQTTFDCGSHCICAYCSGKSSRADKKVWRGIHVEQNCLIEVAGDDIFHAAGLGALRKGVHLEVEIARKLRKA